MYIVGAKTKLRAMMIAYLLHCTVPFYIVGAFAAVSIVTAVMFHSCVVCAVTAGDVVNSQLATYAGSHDNCVQYVDCFFLILDSVSHVDAVKQFFSKSLSFLKKPASATRHATA